MRPSPQVFEKTTRYLEGMAAVKEALMHHAQAVGTWASDVRGIFWFDMKSLFVPRLGVVSVGDIIA